MNYIDREKFIYKYRYLIIISPLILLYLLYNRNIYYKKYKYIFILLILIAGFYTSIILYMLLMGLIWAFLEIKESIKRSLKNSPERKSDKKIPYPKKPPKDLKYNSPEKL